MIELFLFFLGLLLFYNYYWKRRHFPPGPPPLPILGNLGSVASPRPKYQVFLDWSKKYNGIFTIWIGELPCVVICDYALMHSALVKDHAEALSGRYQFVEHLNAIRVEVASLLKRLEEDEKTGICDIIGRFDACIGSVINNLLFGYSFEGSKLREFLELKKNIQELFIHINKSPTILYMNFPWLKHFPYFKRYFEDGVYLNKKIFDFLEQQIKEHEKNIDFNSETTDFCEAFLKEIKHQEEIHGPNKDNYSYVQLKNVCYDLWLAGMETTATTCQFAIIYLLNHPEVLKRAQKELDAVVDNDRLVTMDDKSQLHYLQAVVSEVQRAINLLLFNISHKALDDVVIDGHLIKKGTIVLPQISCVLYDEKVLFIEINVIIIFG
ncbi:hypothetical protein FO519_006961 [Halicephalobus sp. NKZ332]|nr:hypothetical protein FO519_006961 [Halicephalobus sp. NKZ332]